MGKRTWIVVVSVLVLSATVAGVFIYRANRQVPHQEPTLRPIADPRLTFQTPFENVRPDVAYVGDARCAECHRDIARHYSRHPMGRSMTAVSADPGEKLRAIFNNSFAKFDRIFR